MLVRETDFVVCDVETTGLAAGPCRVTEICLLKLNGGLLVDSFESLVNPRQLIPPAITRLTGITNALVQNAPPFEAIAGDVRDFLEGAVFVAHNASFDWSFVRHELERSGAVPPVPDVLCTVRLARRLAPGLRSYALDALASSLGVPARRHHRARSDCETAADIFRVLLARAEEEYDVAECEDLLAVQRSQRRAAPLPKRARALEQQARDFPDSPGVYMFRDSRGEPLYIGKAANLRARTRSYFQPAAQRVRKIRSLLRRSASIACEPLESELHALLREARLIARHQPEFNDALRRKKLFPFLRLDTGNDFPRLEVTTDIAQDGAEYYGPFRTFGAAELALDVAQRLFKLRACRDDLRPRADFSPCFYYDIRRCCAPCALLQSKHDYGREAERVRQFLSSNRDNIIRRVEEAMRDHAERLEFEEAAYLRDRLGEMRAVFEKPMRPMSGETAVTSQHYVFAMRERGECVAFFVRNGQLRKMLRARFGSGLRPALEREIAKVFSQQALDELSQEAAREMRIVVGWVRQRRNDGVLAPVQPGTRPADCADAICAGFAAGGLLLQHE